MQVFVKMLVSALEEKNDSVFLDLLTSRDLDMLKQRGRGDAGSSAAKPLGIQSWIFILIFTGSSLTSR